MKLLLLPIFFVSLRVGAQHTLQTFIQGEAAVGANYENGAISLQSTENHSPDVESDVWKKRSWRFGLEFPFITDFHHELQDAHIWHLRPVGGFFVQQNRTAYLRRKPQNGRVRFGIDYGFCDVDYSCISYLDEHDKFYLNILSYGIHLGPSANIRVADKFNLGIYAHLKPTFSAVFFEGMFDYSFAAYCAGGAQLAWRSIGVGAECQWSPTT